jgi:cholest-4-en-3-one 26-monooxygenase
VTAISKNSKDWSTAENGASIRFQQGMLREQVELQRVILLRGIIVSNALLAAM